MHKAAYYKRKENKPYVGVNMYSFPKSKTNNNYQNNKFYNVVGREIISVNKYQRMETVKAEYHVVKVYNSFFVIFEIGKNKDYK